MFLILQSEECIFSLELWYMLVFPERFQAKYSQLNGLQGERGDAVARRVVHVRISIANLTVI